MYVSDTIKRLQQKRNYGLFGTLFFYGHYYGLTLWFII